MRVLQLTGDQVGSLLAQPESGMGFQIVETSRNYSREPEVWIAFNSELAIALESPAERSGWHEMRNAGSLEWLRAQAVDPGLFYQTPRVVVTRSNVGVSATTYGAANAVAPSPLSLIKQSVTQSNARYSRFSAFSRDKRVDPLTGNFLPGTYATTATDEPMAPSGFSAVGRYSLPNVMPASFVHMLTSAAGAIVHSGTVAPAYGQSGGGVEVFFPNGVQNVTTLGLPKRLPDE